MNNRLQFYKNIIEYALECDYKRLNRWNFYLKVILAHLTRTYCTCDKDGMSGYWEREVCCKCDGWHLKWKWSLRSKFIDFWRHRNHDVIWRYEYDHNKENIIHRGWPWE